jgi:poly-gamma-glutamate capsule biosynthesis protein CapA/YwtB (metallophosphatase superfamily)
MSLGGNREMRKRGSEEAQGLRCIAMALLPCFLASCFLVAGESVTPVLEDASRPTFTLALVGDVMLGRGVAQALNGDWETAFAQVQPWLAEAGLAFANLESPLATAPYVSGGYDLRAPPEAVAALDVAGFDVVSLANNHALDAGGVGLAQTLTALDTVGIAGLVGWETGRLVDWETGSLVDRVPSPTYQPTNIPIYQSTNTPIYHLLAFDDTVAPLDWEAAADAVAAAASRADLVIVSIHWGGEYQAAPTSRQRAIAEELTAAGADLIVGHGPHVPQRVEWMGETLVAYSLGNFLFDQPYPADCRWGVVLRITLWGDRIVAVEALPTVADQGRVRPADPEDAAAILTRLALEPAPNIQRPLSDIQHPASRSTDHESLPSNPPRHPAGRH